MEIGNIAISDSVAWLAVGVVTLAVVLIVGKIKG
jgi:hypothetical protein